MKKTLLILTALLFSIGAFGQRTQNVGLELCGSSTGLGVRYDTRFNGNNGFGLSVGAAYAHGTTAAYDKGCGQDNILFPIEVNYLTGSANSHFEVGLGMVNARYHYHYGHYSEYGNYLYANAGWRYQKPTGFMFRAGLTPIYGRSDYEVKIFGHHAKMNLSVYIGVGWSF